MKTKPKVPPIGTIRKSQVLTTFGPGAMVDMPDHSIIIGGLDHWYGEKKPVYEDRLASRVGQMLEIPNVEMYEPPVDTANAWDSSTGIAGFMFPEWFLAQIKEQSWADPRGKKYRTRPLVHWAKLEKGKYFGEDRKPHPVVPVRFIQACLNGHISDLDWYSFVHESFSSKCRGQLWLDEGGTGGDLAEIFVRCEACKARRPLSAAKIPKQHVLGYCKGHRPWLGPKASEPCIGSNDKPEPNRLLIRSASNSYFAQKLSVISIPDQDMALKEAVDKVFEDFLKYAEGVDDIKRDRRKDKVASAIKDFTDEVVWKEIKRRKSGHAPIEKSIKQLEIETLLASPEGAGEEGNGHEDIFFARTRPLGTLPAILKGRLDRVVLVHRLREVIAQVGFTRFEAAMPDIDGELSLEVRRAALAIDTTWVPAVESKGEGVFVSFSKEEIDKWQKKPAVKARAEQLATGFENWKKAKGITEGEFPGLPYVMLHSLSHLLITAVSLECGYAASSVRERVYAGETGYGILLYTATPGAEGTLGGLIQVGKSIENHLVKALGMGRLCSNDPVCAQHNPDDIHEERYLHGAACHGCLLIAEPSCERRNEFLDRALVIPTVDNIGAEFFED